MQLNRMAMDRLKQALGLQITDNQLIALLRRDMNTADPAHQAYGKEGSYELGPYLEPSPDRDDVDDLAALMQQNQGRLLIPYKYRNN